MCLQTSVRSDGPSPDSNVEDTEIETGSAAVTQMMSRPFSAVTNLAWWLITISQLREGVCLKLRPEFFTKCSGISRQSHILMLVSNQLLLLLIIINCQSNEVSYYINYNFNVLNDLMMKLQYFGDYTDVGLSATVSQRLEVSCYEVALSGAWLNTKSTKMTFLSRATVVGTACSFPPRLISYLIWNLTISSQWCSNAP